MTSFMDKAHTVIECLHAYGIHSATLQPELSMSCQTTPPSEAVTVGTPVSETDTDSPGDALPSFPVSVIRRRIISPGSCQIPCGALCEKLSCCKAL